MNENTTVIDPCVDCGESTAPGFGRWVNRLPTDGGFQCIECLGSVFDCDRCAEAIPFDEDSTEVILVDRGDVKFYQSEVRVGPCCATTD